MKISEEDFKKYLTIICGLEIRSVDTYSNRFRIISRWLSANNTTLSKKSVGDFLYFKKESLSNSGVNTYIHVIQHIEGCYKHHDLQSGFAEGIKGLPKTQTNIIPLSKEEVDKLLATGLTYMNRNGVDNNDLDFKYLTFTAFMIYTGCRFGEARSLKIANLDIDNGRATLLNTKNKQNRYIFFREPIIEKLRKLVDGRNPDDLVFTNSKGNNMYYGDFNNNLRLRAKNAGITKYVHAHLLRHSYATELYKSTHDITIVAKVIGHKDIGTTYSTYVHLDTAEIQKAADKHPFIARYISPEEKLNMFKNAMEEFGMNKDDRFHYNLEFGNGEMCLRLKIKNL